MIMLCGGCAAWDQSAPPSSTAQCPAFEQAVTTLNTHIDRGHTTYIGQWFQESTDHITVLVDFALNASKYIHIAPSEQDSGSLDGAATEAIWQALLPAQSSATDAEPIEAQAERCALAIDAIGQCLTSNIVALVETIAADPRGPLRLKQLLQAAGQRRDSKRSALAELGLDQQDAFITLAASLLKSLSNPEVNADTLVQLLQGLKTSQNNEKSIMSALTDMILVLITDPQGQLSENRRALTAKALECLTSKGRSEAIGWLLFRLLVVLDLPAGVEFPSLATWPDELIAKIRRDEVMLSAARSWLQIGFGQGSGPSLVRELRDVTNGPVAKALAQVLQLLTGQARCEPNDD